MPFPVPEGFGWLSWVFLAMAIAAFAVILVQGIRRYRSMNETDDDRRGDEPGDGGTGR